MKLKMISFVVIVTLFAAGASALGAGQDQVVTVLKSVAFQITDKGFDVTLGIEGEFVYQVQTLATPTRLAIDLSPVSKIDAPAYTEISQTGLISIRSGRLTDLIARVVLDFSEALPGYEVAKTDMGLVIHFSTEAPPPEKPAVAAPPVKQQPIVAPVKPAETTVETAPAETLLGFANTMIGVNLGSYQIPSAVFKEIYGADATRTLGLTLSRTLIQYQTLSFDVEGGIRFYSKTGASAPDQDAATFKMTPISLALRMNYLWKYFQVFAGYGLDWYSYTETSTIANTTGKANGHHFTGGIYLIPPVLDGIFRLKIYYKSTKVTANSNGIAVDLGGNEYGIGLSLGFNLFKKGVLSF